MKKYLLCFFFFCSLLFFSSSNAAAINYTDDFANGSGTYVNGETLIGRWGGSDGSWGSSYTWGTYNGLDSAKWTLSSSQGYYIGVTDDSQGAYRTFPDITSGITLTVEFKIANANAFGIFPSIMFGDSTGGPTHDGPKVTFTKQGPNLKLSANTATGVWSDLYDCGAVTTADLYVEFSSINFDAKTYSVRVKPSGGEYNAPVTKAFYNNNDVSSIKYFAVGQASNSADVYIDNINIQGVPEPSSIAFFGMGLLGLAGAGMRRIRAAKA